MSVTHLEFWVGIALVLGAIHNVGSQVCSDPVKSRLLQRWAWVWLGFAIVTAAAAVVTALAARG